MTPNEQAIEELCKCGHSGLQHCEPKEYGFGARTTCGCSMCECHGFQGPTADERRIAELEAEVGRLKAELRPYQPMTLEEIDEALLTVEAEPLTDEEIAQHVKFATDPVYRAEHLQERLTVYMRTNRGLRYQVGRLREALRSIVARHPDPATDKDHPAVAIARAALKEPKDAL